LESLSVNPSGFKTSLEVFTELGEGNRQKRYTLMFDPILDRLSVKVGASAASLAQLLGEIIPEHIQAFQHSLLSM